jgi:hypothetical protein
MRITNYSAHVPTDKEKHLAEFDVEGIETEKGQMALRRFRLMKGKKDGYFISWPAYFVPTEDGSKKFILFCDLGLEKKKAVDSELYTLLKPFCPLLCSPRPF